MQASKWLVAIGLVLVTGFFVYQWSNGAPTEEVPQTVGTATPPEVAEERERPESLEPPSSSAGDEIKSSSETESNTPVTGAADVVNPFLAPPEGNSGQTENAEVESEIQESAPETEQSESTTRDLLKEVPDSYPIENAEAYYVPPEERYPGNLGGPPPLKLPSISAPEADGGVEESSGELAPPAPF